MIVNNVMQRDCQVNEQCNKYYRKSDNVRCFTTGKIVEHGSANMKQALRGFRELKQFCRNSAKFFSNNFPTYRKISVFSFILATKL